MSLVYNFNFKQELLKHAIRQEQILDGNNLAALTGRYAVEMPEDIIDVINHNDLSAERQVAEIAKILLFRKK